MKLNLLIKNGHVVDTTQNIDKVMDIGIYANRIVPVEQDSDASKVIDAKGCYVLPGLIDFHTHLFYGGSGFGIKPDWLLSHGVTSAVDAGSAGCDNYEAFHNSIITNSTVRIRSFLNISSGGLYDAIIPENVDPSLFNERLICSIIDKYGEKVLGLKIRINEEVVGELGSVEPLSATVKLAEKIGGLSVCVHTTDSVCTASEVASILRKGDIFAHCFHGTVNGIMDSNSEIFPDILNARKRGILFDESNGSKNYSNQIAAIALGKGFFPDIISTDLSTVTLGTSNRCRSLPFVMSRSLSMGMTLPQVVKTVTETPAKLMNMEGEIGTLREGAFADIAIFKLEKQQISFDDIDGNIYEGDQVLIPQMTITDGRVVYSQTTFNNEIC